MGYHGITKNKEIAMSIQWFENIPTSGVLCHCKDDVRDKHGRIDVIKRYNHRQYAEQKFRSDSKFYYDATPLTIDEAMQYIHSDLLIETIQ